MISQKINDLSFYIKVVLKCILLIDFRRNIIEAYQNTKYIKVFF